MTGRTTLRSFSPIFPVRDLRAALAHYASLGFTTLAYGGGDGYGFAERDGVGLHLSAEGDDVGAHATGVVYLYVDDADALHAEWALPGIGGRTLPVNDTPYNLREGAHFDPDGNLIRFGSPSTGGTLPDRIGAHLERTYQVSVTRLLPLDLGVLRVDLAGGARWVARAFPPTRPLQAVQGDADVLEFVAEQGFPAERCATSQPISEFEGRRVLLTEYVEGAGRQQRRDVIKQLGGLRRLGELLGELHTLPEPPASVARDGGAWHHLADGSPAAEVEEALALLGRAVGLVPPGGGQDYDALAAALREVDTCEGLPRALIHPDFVLQNVIASPDRGMVLVDWTGAGLGPRLWPLAFLLFAEATKSLRRIELVLDGYRRRLEMVDEEIERVRNAALARPVVFAVWRFCMGRASLPEAVAQVTAARRTVDAVEGHLRHLAI
jgi:aminoglycoside phosphotransferase (APT) family kinase protein